ncbi:hypothetical protein K502DRAFT_365787 [Neoconidiobolus thromboides FSU 785]|nr:hypothetical protein K502DRAFT_365787 [Neoconidiobolus thromboides FSU 785]
MCPVKDTKKKENPLIIGNYITRNILKRVCSLDENPLPEEKVIKKDGRGRPKKIYSSAENGKVHKKHPLTSKVSSGAKREALKEIENHEMNTEIIVTYNINDEVLVLDRKGIWCEAIVIKQESDKVCIKYKNEASYRNEWIRTDQNRIKPLSFNGVEETKRLGNSSSGKMMPLKATNQPKKNIKEFKKAFSLPKKDRGRPRKLLQVDNQLNTSTKYIKNETKLEKPIILEDPTPIQNVSNLPLNSTISRSDGWTLYCNECNSFIEQYRYYCLDCKSSTLNEGGEDFDLCPNCYLKKFPKKHEHPRLSFAVECLITEHNVNSYSRKKVGGKIGYFPTINSNSNEPSGTQLIVSYDQDAIFPLVIEDGNDKEIKLIAQTDKVRNKLPPSLTLRYKKEIKKSVPTIPGVYRYFPLFNKRSLPRKITCVFCHDTDSHVEITGELFDIKKPFILKPGPKMWQKYAARLQNGELSYSTLKYYFGEVWTKEIHDLLKPQNKKGRPKKGIHSLNPFESLINMPNFFLDLFWCHINCAKFVGQVLVLGINPSIKNPSQSDIYNISRSVRDSNKHKCSKCRGIGAMIGCTKDDCSKYYHLKCTGKSIQQFLKGVVFFCPYHESLYYEKDAFNEYFHCDLCHLPLPLDPKLEYNDQGVPVLTKEMQKEFKLQYDEMMKQKLEEIVNIEEEPDMKIDHFRLDTFSDLSSLTSISEIGDQTFLMSSPVSSLTDVSCLNIPDWFERDLSGFKETDYGTESRANKKSELGVKENGIHENQIEMKDVIQDVLQLDLEANHINTNGIQKEKEKSNMDINNMDEKYCLGNNDTLNEIETMNGNGDENNIPGNIDNKNDNNNSFQNNIEGPDSDNSLLNMKPIEAKEMDLEYSFDMEKANEPSINNLHTIEIEDALIEIEEDEDEDEEDDKLDIENYTLDLHQGSDIIIDDDGPIEKIVDIDTNEEEIITEEIDILNNDKLKYSWFTCFTCLKQATFSSYDLCSLCYHHRFELVEHDHDKESFVITDQDRMLLTSTRSKVSLPIRKKRNDEQEIRNLKKGRKKLQCAYCWCEKSKVWRKSYYGVLLCHQCFSSGEKGKLRKKRLSKKSKGKQDKKQSNQYNTNTEEYTHLPYNTRTMYDHYHLPLDNNQAKLLDSYGPKENQSYSLNLYSTYLDIPGRAPRWASHSASDYHGTWLAQTVRRSLLKYTKPGALVLSNFLGRGTDAIECFLNGRKCIGVDINPVAITLSQKNCSFALPPSLKMDVSLRPLILQGDARNLSNLSKINECKFDHILSHPPYKDCVQYSTNLSGDLSRISNELEFQNQMSLVAKESWKLLKTNGRLTLGIGDNRSKCFYIPVGYQTIRSYMNIGFELEELILKRQRQCQMYGLGTYLSEKFDFLILTHEYIAIFRKRKKEVSKRIAAILLSPEDVLYGKGIIKVELIAHGVPNYPINRKENIMGTVWLFETSEIYSFENLIQSRMIERFAPVNKNWEEAKLNFIYEQKSEMTSPPKINNSDKKQEINEYERKRLNRIRQNNQMMLKLGLNVDINDTTNDDINHYDFMMSLPPNEKNLLGLIYISHIPNYLLASFTIPYLRKTILQIIRENYDRLDENGLFIIGIQDYRLHKKNGNRLIPLSLLVLEDIIRNFEFKLKLKEFIVCVPEGWKLSPDKLENGDEDFKSHLPIVHVNYYILVKSK